MLKKTLALVDLLVSSLSANAIGAEHSTPTDIKADGRMGWEAANTWAVIRVF